MSSPITYSPFFVKTNKIYEQVATSPLPNRSFFRVIMQKARHEDGLLANFFEV